MNDRDDDPHLHPRLACATLDLLALVAERAEHAQRLHGNDAHDDPSGPDRDAAACARRLVEIATSMTSAIHELLGAQSRCRPCRDHDAFEF